MNGRRGEHHPAGRAHQRLGRRAALAALAGLIACSAGSAWGQVEPPAEGPRRVIFLAQDFRNGGITAVYRGFEEACRELGWTLRVINGGGDAATVRRLFDEAWQSGVDGIVLGGFDEADIVDRLTAPSRHAPVLVGWHASSRIGATAHLFANVSTDPAVVADMAAAFATQSSGTHTGVVIFNDSRFDIANFKTARMRDALARCGKCELLSIEDLPISAASKDMPAALERLQLRYGARWTHVLAINDVYIDSMYFPLAALGRRDVVAISAGDGSRTALSRIRSGRSQQLATVAEPTALQGWQLADELRRAFTGLPPSGVIAKPIAVTNELMLELGQQDIDATLPFRAEYRQQWAGAVAGGLKPK
jgi:ribose transport system substrate-binding protein